MVLLRGHCYRRDRSGSLVLAVSNARRIAGARIHPERKQHRIGDNWMAPVSVADDNMVAANSVDPNAGRMRTHS